MNMITHAYVIFHQGGRRLPYIVPIEDISDFSPKAASDFRKNHLYTVKWERTNSDLGQKSDSYDAKICCLGASIKEVQMQADALNLKKPNVMPPKICNSPAAPKQDTRNRPAKLEARVKQVSQIKKQDVTSVKKKRQLAALEVAQENLRKEKKPSAGDCLNKSESESSSNTVKKASVKTAENVHDSKGIKKHRHGEQGGSQEKKRRELEDDKSKGSCDKFNSKEDRPNTKIKTSIGSDSTALPPRTNSNFTTFAVTPPKGIKKHRHGEQGGSQEKKRRELEDDESKGSCDKFNPKEDRPNTKIKTSIGSDSTALPPRTNSDFTTFAVTPPKKKQPIGGELDSDSSSDEDDVLLSPSKARKLNEDKILAEARMKSAYEKLKRKEEELEKMRALLKAAEGKEDRSENEGETQGQPPALLRRNRPSISSEGSNIDAEPEAEPSAADQANNFSEEPLTDEETISERVYQDLTGGSKLQEVKGNKVYLGQGFSVPRELWTKKLKQCKKDTMFVNDLTIGLWGKESLKKRTVDGKSAKNKLKATPQKVNVANAAFKGRLRARGVTDPEMIKLHLQKARNRMQQTFYEAGRPPRKPKNTRVADEHADDPSEADGGASEAGGSS